MAPLPIVKPIEYEEWLQDYFNAHPTIGDKNLQKALQESMNVTCGRQALRTWLGNHAAIVAEPIIQLEDHEDFLWEQLAKEPLIGRYAMRTALREARGVDVK